jgi:RNA polymerase sigma-70 factor (ECF subfamily)
VQKAHDFFPDCPEALIVSLARSGDRSAFSELVRRRQSSVRHLLRRCCNDVALADDLAQKVFLRAWLKIRTLKHATAFGSWLKRISINTWLQYLRKNDALRDADEIASC